MFIKNNRRFNLNAYLDSFYIDENGTQHPGQLLRDPAFRESQGIIEIPDPERGNDETQYTQEIDVEPYVIITDKSPEQIAEITIAKYSNTIQGILDAKAQDYKYDSILSACSYASSTNTKFAGEAVKFVAWRDACWDYAYTVLNSGTVPSLEDFIAGLPVLVEGE